MPKRRKKQRRLRKKLRKKLKKEEEDNNLVFFIKNASHNVKCERRFFYSSKDVSLSVSVSVIASSTAGKLDVEGFVGCVILV